MIEKPMQKIYRHVFKDNWESYEEGFGRHYVAIVAQTPSAQTLWALWIQTSIHYTDGIHTLFKPESKILKKNLPAFCLDE